MEARLTLSAGELPLSPTLDEVRDLAADYDLVPVVCELLADCDTPVSAFLRLGDRPGSFLLESVEGGERLARYSFLGSHPSATIECRDGVATIHHSVGTWRQPYEDPLAVLNETVAQRKVAPLPGNAVPFPGGAVGYLSYEAATCFERLPTAGKDPLGLPQAWFALMDTVIVFDHATHTMRLVTHVVTRAGADVERGYAEATARLRSLHVRLRRPLPPALPAFDTEHEPATESDRSANLSRDEFLAKVERCREYITAGDIFQVQVGRRFALPLRAQPFEVYRTLRSLNPSPYMFYISTPSASIVGASPEMLVRVTGDHIDYHPIAGTRRRGRTLEQDLKMEAELRESEKERAEHLMLVDLGRNDVGRVSQTGTVNVSDYMEIERYSHVMHMVSSITGKKQPDLSACDVLRACFPAGTVTGAPKIRSMEIIAEQEPETRGVYAGAVGYLGYGGDLDTAIALRTLVVQDGVAYAQASAGIVADSTPKDEALEIDNKVAALLLAVERANAGAAR